jgi:hypothetical protein
MGHISLQVMLLIERKHKDKTVLDASEELVLNLRERN